MTNEEAIRCLSVHSSTNGSGLCTDEQHYEAKQMAIKVIEQTTWIPVSERLPEDEQEILFSTKTGRVHSGKYHDDDSANQWYSHEDKCRAWNNVVSAWMPLPQAYREVEE